jgi:uncharacterized protein
MAKAKKAGFRERYGAWALVAGASQGLGAAWARGIAARGVNVVLAARRRELLEPLAQDLRARYGVEVRFLDGDLADRSFVDRLAQETSHLELGLLVYNAAYAPVGDFAAQDPDALSRLVDVNVRAPALLARAAAARMAARGRGGMIFMSSLAGNQGSPRLAAYAASKAFNRILAESLWKELKPRGIDVMVCLGGAIRTPGYLGTAGKEAPGTMDPEVVAETALRALGRGPIVIPGLVNRIAFTFMGRLLPRRAAIGIMAGSTGGLSS